METTEETNGGNFRIGVAHRHDMDGHALPLAGHLAQGARLEMRTARVDDLGQGIEVRHALHGHDYDG
jgi:hypothetical protein